MAGIERRPGIAYSVLTPNLKGFDAALAAGADEVAIFASASEGFSRANINCSIAESLTRFEPVMAAAAGAGISVRGYVSCVTDCPYDGPVRPRDAARVASALVQMGCFEVSLGDTIGRGTPLTVSRMLEAVLHDLRPEQLAGHFHDTNGMALANLEAALGFGIRCFDASVGGLGGCPYAPGAKGNVDTGAVVDLLEQRGFDTGIDRQRLAEAAAFARGLAGR
jgi:hydroxymethylglutaryl-CoA lyase